VTTPRWLGLAPVELPVECAGHSHRLRWAAGELSALEHPDAERERMLAALGADPYACLEIVDLWNRHADDLEVLVQASRGPADPLGADDRFERRGGVRYRGGWQPLSRSSRPRPGTSFGWYMNGPGAQSDDAPSGDGGLARLLTLGGGLPERLVATVVGTWVERDQVMDPRAVEAAPTLKAALYGRLAAVVQEWLGPSASVELSVVEPDGSPRLIRNGAGLRAELPITWLRDVWCRDLATIRGRFTLSARPTGAKAWELITVAPDLGPPQKVTLEL
jgi:hypothetical protein